MSGCCPGNDEPNSSLRGTKILHFSDDWNAVFSEPVMHRYDDGGRKLICDLAGLSCVDGIESAHRYH